MENCTYLPPLKRFPGFSCYIPVNQLVESINGWLSLPIHHLLPWFTAAEISLTTTSTSQRTPNLLRVRVSLSHLSRMFNGRMFDAWLSRNF